MFGVIQQMFDGARNRIGKMLISILLKKREKAPELLFDYPRLKSSLIPGDVILVEGCTHVARIIQMVSHSRWSHSAMCVGRLQDFKMHLPDTVDQSLLDPSAVYLVEAELGKGTVLTPVDEYQKFRLRVCRATGLTVADQRKVVCYAVNRLGAQYNVRQIADLARFMFPYGILPRRWRSSLFEHNAGSETKIVCSTLLADAFQAVKFPILPIVSENVRGESRLFKRNAKLFAPSDFDISPYFDVLKFPKFTIDHEDQRYYHHLPWATQGESKSPHVEIDPAYYADKPATSENKLKVSA